MKTYLKVILTILLIIATIMSIVSALVSGVSIIGNLYANSMDGMNFFGILSFFTFFASAGLCLAFLSFFLVIAIACIVGIVYVFVSGSEKRIKELEAVVNNATTNQESTENSND